VNKVAVRDLRILKRFLKVKVVHKTVLVAPLEKHSLGVIVLGILVFLEALRKVD
jgi:hypothetical protein